MKVLWLASWYPNRSDPYKGDFIQRHAIAASIYDSIEVIHVCFDEKARADIFYQNKNYGLVENISILKNSRVILLKKIINHYRYLRENKRLIKKYIDDNNVPALVHVHVMLKAGLLALWMKKKYNVPYIISEHWSIYNKESGKKISYISRLISKKILKNANNFLPVSDHLGKSVSGSVIAKPFQVIYNNADTNLFNYKEKTGTFSFIHVSMMTPEKNTTDILKAFLSFQKKYPQAMLIMAGPEKEELRNLIEHNSQVHLTGLLKYNEVAEQMKKAHAFILFSDFENLPCVICEALCCGLPVISSDVGGVKEIINETNGLLVEKRNTTQLLSAMESVYLNYEKYNRLSISRDAVSKFSYSTIGEQIHGIYKTITSSE